MTPHALIAPARLAGAPLLRAQSDERLVDLVRAGNEAAFEAIVARYRRPLLRYCSGFMSEARAEDAVQTTLVSAFDALRSTRGEMTLRPWLYRIAHNTALNALRDRALHYEELSEEIDGVERPDQAYDRNESLRDLVAALGALPDRQRHAMVLHELEGRSYEEIATKLGVSDGSVRQLLNRARNTLRSGATAVTPFGLLARGPWGTATGEGVTARVAEMCAGGAGGAALTKVCATAMVTGAVMVGVGGPPSGRIEDGRAGRSPGDAPRQAASNPRSQGPAAAVALTGSGDRTRSADDRGGAGGRREDDVPGDDHRPGRGRQDEADDHGDRDGGRVEPNEPEHGDSSGPGGGDDDSGSGSTGGSGEPDEADSPDPGDGVSSGPDDSDGEEGSGSGGDVDAQLSHSGSASDSSGSGSGRDEEYGPLSLDE